MVFGSPGFESMLGGTHVAFKFRKGRSHLEKESIISLENKRVLQTGITILRKLRTLALRESNEEVSQEYLEEAHQISEKMAGQIIAQSYARKPYPIDSSFLEILSSLDLKYKDAEAGSWHGIPPSYSVSNLFIAAEDMFARVGETAKSIYKPTHKLAKEEMKFVLNEFLRGTNRLTINAINTFFQEGTSLCGILSGGSVYTEMVKTISAQYSNSLPILPSSVVAVDKEANRSIFQINESNASVKDVLLVDDMIDGGGTVISALWEAGRYFPSANIRSGMDTDYAGGFEKRRTKNHMSHLECIFYDFADYVRDGKKSEAMAIYHEAEKYANTNGVQLQPGWKIKKERMESQSVYVSRLI